MEGLLKKNFKVLTIWKTIDEFNSIKIQGKPKKLTIKEGNGQNY